MTESPTHYSKAQRRLLGTLGGIGVIALAGGAFVLSYADLRALALQGGAVRRWVYLYPGMFDGLVVVVILSLLTVRRARWWSRAVRWLLLLVLVAAAGAASVQRALKGYEVLRHDWVTGGVAATPWVILVVAVWLWLAMLKQALNARSRRRREPGPRPDPAPATAIDQAIIPGLVEREDPTRPLPRPLAERRLEPARGFETGIEDVPVTAVDAARPGLPEPQHATAHDRDPAAHEGTGPHAPRRPEPGDTVSIERDRKPLYEPRRAHTAPPEAYGEREDPTEPHHDATDAPPLPLYEPRREDHLFTPDQAEPMGPPAAYDDDAADAATGEAPTQDTGPARPRPSHDDAEPKDVPSDAAEGGHGRNDQAGPVVHERESGPKGRPDAAEEAGPSEEAPVDETPVDPVPGPQKDEQAGRPGRRWVARTSLPTDVRLVGGPPAKLVDTWPDGFRLPDTNPDGIPVPRPAGDDDDGTYADDRAEDPDAGEPTDHRWHPPGPAPVPDDDVESTPPASKFRSGPTPPRG